MEPNKGVGHFNVSRASPLILGVTASTTRGQYLSIWIGTLKFQHPTFDTQEGHLSQMHFVVRSPCVQLDEDGNHIQMLYLPRYSSENCKREKYANTDKSTIS